MIAISPERRTAFGLLVTVAGALVFVPDALVLRLIGTDLVAVAVWRGLIAAPVFFLVCAVTTGLPPLRWYISRTAVPVSLCEGASTVLFCASIGATTVANTLVILAAAPFIAAVLSRVLLGERIAWETRLAIAATFTGVAVIATGGFSGVNGGDLLPLANAFTVAALFVALRRAGDQNMLPAIAVGQLVGVLMGLPFASFEPLAAAELGLLLLSGLVILPLGVGLLSLGPRYLSAPEVAMILSLEMVSSPFLVWLVLGEVPSAAGFVGGTIVVTAVVAHALWRLRTASRVEAAA
jgi:drug/metabolite transporter (DMT)-like permease